MYLDSVSFSVSEVRPQIFIVYKYIIYLIHHKHVYG